MQLSTQDYHGTGIQISAHSNLWMLFSVLALIGRRPYSGYYLQCGSLNFENLLLCAILTIGSIVDRDAQYFCKWYDFFASC